MLTEKFFLRFAWGPRKESVEECAQHLSQFLDDLKGIDRGFKTWQAFDGNRSLPLGSMQLEKWLRLGVNRDEVEHQIIPELGFSISLSTQSGIDMRIRCGVYGERLHNVCSIAFPQDEQVLERVQPSVLMRISQAVIRNWKPDEGVVASHQCIRLVQPANFKSEAGWVTFVSDEIKKKIAIPATAQVEQAGNGWLILATDEVFSSSNPKHIQIVTELTRSLERANGQIGN